METLQEKPPESLNGNLAYVNSYDAIDDQDTIRLVIERLDDPASMQKEDWSTREPSPDLNKRLIKLASIKADLPPDNKDKQKGQHNRTLENYKKLALITAGDCETLRLFLSLLQTKMQKDQNKNLAKAVFEIWIDVADVAGERKIKKELEELAFKVYMPEEHAEVEQAYANLGGTEAIERLIDYYKEVLEDIFADGLGPGMDFSIECRRKTYYSVWRKVEKDKRADYRLSDFKIGRAHV